MNYPYQVSIIIPFYNVATFIEKSARSLLNQRFESIQYIFVDDASTDISLDLLKRLINEFPNRVEDITILENKSNLGSSGSRNKGLEIVKGKYLTFCDGDDTIDENGILEMFNAIESSKADILWTDFYYSYPDSEKLSIQAVVEDKNEFIKNLLQEKVHGALWNKLYKFSLFQDHKIKFIPNRDMWEDLYLNIQLFHFATKITYLPKAYYHYVQFNSSSLGTRNNPKKLEDILFHCQAIIEFLAANSNKTYLNEIASLKFAAKQTLLFSTEINSFKRWITIYPEVNDQAFQTNRLPLHLKTIAWLTSQNMWGIIKIWINIKNRKQ